MFLAKSISKKYGNVVVLREVDFDLASGEIHALLGANGAGKSTLCKIISGLLSPSTGTMDLDGDSYRPTGKREAEERGVQIIQQELNLIATLSIAENMFLSRLPHRGGVIRKRRLDIDSRDALTPFGLAHLDPRMSVGRLGVGQQQMIEIATAISRDCKVLILDEPTSALSDAESKILFDRLDDLRARGVALLYISHRLEEIREIADRVTVLRDGQKVCTRSIDQLSSDDMVRLMGGDDPANSIHAARQFHSHIETSAEPVLSVRGLTYGRVKDISFEVRAGERFGLTGLVGSGRTELLRTVFGADTASSGTVQVGERKPVRFSHPAQAVAEGLAFATEDRKCTGLLLSRSVRENVTLVSLARRFSRRGLVDGRRQRRAVREICNRLATRRTNDEQPVGELSGGNQQKVAVAKWLMEEATVFLFDEPTRGIDAAARRRLYQLFEEMAGSGKGIVIVSSDLDELFETCDTIGVMRDGRLSNCFSRGTWSKEAILQASFSGVGATVERIAEMRPG